VLVIVGSRHDPAVSDIVKQWAAWDVTLLSCEDLSTAGWRHRVGDSVGSQAVIGGAIVAEPDIRGVLVRRPWIMDLELTHIALEDREYVAAEMNAFLTSWLVHLDCAVLNRPQGTCLCGPNWRPLQWVQAASLLGIPAEPVRCSIPASDVRNISSEWPQESQREPPIEVTVVGNRCFGSPTAHYALSAQKLAEFARTPLLAVRFRQHCGSPRFISATAMPGLKDAEIASAVRDYLLSETAA
jgi:hypothetical protein